MAGLRIIAAALLLAANAYAACTDEVGNSNSVPICKGGSGTLLPVFNAQGEADWPGGLKIVLYFIGLIWEFSG